MMSNDSMDDFNMEVGPSLSAAKLLLALVYDAEVAVSGDSDRIDYILCASGELYATILAVAVVVGRTTVDDGAKYVAYMANELIAGRDHDGFPVPFTGDVQ
jgi:hypothetical protein